MPDRPTAEVPADWHIAQVGSRTAKGEGQPAEERQRKPMDLPGEWIGGGDGQAWRGTK